MPAVTSVVSQPQPKLHAILRMKLKKMRVLGGGQIADTFALRLGVANGDDEDVFALPDVVFHVEAVCFVHGLALSHHNTVEFQRGDGV